MAWYYDVFLVVFLVNIGLSTMGSIPFYYVGTQPETIGAGVDYQQNSQLNETSVLNTVGCTAAANQSLACSPPSFLANPSFFTGAVFGWIYGGLVAAASMVAAPYFVYNLVMGFVNYAPLAGLIAAGLAVVYYAFWLLLLTGRYFEQ